MEKQSFIAPWQIIIMLLITRLPFSTVYIAGLNAGRSVQDIMLAVPVNFIINFIVAIPLLMLMKRHPGKDPVECAYNILGKPAGVIVSFIYMLFFLGLSVQMLAVFQLFFVNGIIPEADYNVIVIPMLLVCIYAAVKGIETIARVGTVVFIGYLITLTILFLSLIPSIKLGFLFPQFYNGPQIFLQSVLAGFNSNPQILFLVFCAPFLKTGTKTGKIFAKWNVTAAVLFLFLEFLIVTVMGPFSAKQNFPLYTLTMQSQIDVFERLDAVDMISWILSTVFFISFYLYLLSHSLTKIGLNKHRTLTVFISATLIYFITDYISTAPVDLHDVYTSPVMTAVTVVLLMILPIVLLISDIIKGRIAADEKAV